jgi:hypothetical protein
MHYVHYGQCLQYATLQDLNQHHSLEFLMTRRFNQFLTLNRTVVFLSLGYIALLGITNTISCFTLQLSRFHGYNYKGLLLDKFYVDMTPICFS